MAVPPGGRSLLQENASRSGRLRRGASELGRRRLPKGSDHLGDYGAGWMSAAYFGERREVSALKGAWFSLRPENKKAGRCPAFIWRSRVLPDCSDKTRIAKKSVLDGFLEFFGSAESDFLAGLNLDLFAGRRVTAHARRTLTDLQDAETADADLVTLLEMLREETHEVAQNLTRNFL